MAPQGQARCQVLILGSHSVRCRAAEGVLAPALYRVSFLWYCTLSLLITLVVGVTVSGLSALLLPAHGDSKKGFNVKASKKSFKAKDGASLAAAPAPRSVPPTGWVAVSSETSLEEDKEDADVDTRPEKLLVRPGDKETSALQVSALGRLPAAAR